ncbi:MAG: IPTL-CTERM sorting domain-containing protein [Candidatus Kapabacteria bacterium]|nr:IPTL-CTERM sorting domain-containing protein [Candidatus Kapabacteria bacterium]
MKIIKYILILMLLPMMLSAQTNQTDVFPAGGGQSDNTQYKNFGTIGQPAASTSSNSSYKNKEGFLNAQYLESIILTQPVYNITNNSAISGGSIKLIDDGNDVTQKGVVWSTSAMPTTLDNDGITEQGAGPTSGNSTIFASNLTGMQLGTKYYVRAYMVNSEGTFYGQQRIFTTIPTLGEWGLIALGLLFASFGGWFVMRKMV